MSAIPWRSGFLRHAQVHLPIRSNWRSGSLFSGSICFTGPSGLPSEPRHQTNLQRPAPGSASFPLPGVDAAVFNEKGDEADANEGGHLVIRSPWPGMLRGVFGDPERFKKTYFSRYDNVYDAEDGARKDDEGYFWIMGRLDDVINVSGHRLGTAEIESALVAHKAVAEAAVVGMPHPVKGQTIYAYVTLTSQATESEELKDELCKHVRSEIGPIATPEFIQWAPGLPKTRSGKIMRRVLRKIAAGDSEDFGDTSTLADPSIVEDLVKGKKIGN